MAPNLVPPKKADLADQRGAGARARQHTAANTSGQNVAGPLGFAPMHSNHPQLRHNYVIGAAQAGTKFGGPPG